MNRDIQTFIIWKNSRNIEDLILKKIKEKFSILKEFEITWAPELFGENLSAFYGDNFIYNMFQRKTRGEGSFVFVIVEDLNPIYETRMTGRGEVYLNIHSFELKQNIRQHTGSFAFHSSNNTKEARHDIALLLGKNMEDFLSTTLLDGKREMLNQDTPPARGWKNLREFFYILNETCNYVVLRGWDALPDTHTYQENGDIDLLVDDMKAFLAILNPKIPTHKNMFHFFNWEDFGEDNKNLLVHPKFVGDNYYDINMSRKILETKVLNDKKIYIPSEEMYFWSLLHHGIFHKENWQKYDTVFSNIAPRIGVEYRSDKEYLCNLMTNYMKKNNYKVAKHLDNKAASLMINNIKDKKIMKQEPEFYYFSNNNNSRFLVFSDDAIFYKPALVTKLIDLYDIFLDLHKRELSKNSSLYKYIKKCYKKGQKIWHFNKRYDDISVFAYTNNRKKISFDKKFLSGKRKIISEYLTYIEELNVKDLGFENTVLDNLLETYIQKGMNYFNIELEKFVSEVFYRFQDEKLSDCLRPVSWDLLPKNCFYDCKNLRYIFFDKEVLYNKPLSKSMYLANLVIDFDNKFQFTNDEKYMIYKNLVDKFRLEDIWYWMQLQRYKELVQICCTNNSSCYDLTNLFLKRNSFECLFSVKNKYSHGKKHKEINILGIKIKFRIKNLKSSIEEYK